MNKDPQAARIRGLQRRAQQYRSDLRAAIAVMEVMDSTNAPEAARVPIRQMIADARQGLQQVAIDRKAAAPVDDMRVWELDIRARSAERLKAKIAAIRKGGYTTATRNRLIWKARAKEAAHLRTTFALKAAAKAKRDA